jgi:DNA-binding CsgD family transcriptional regulator
VSDDLRRARVAHGQRAWNDAFELFSAADGVEALAPADLELLASAAYLVGRDDDALGAFERAHQAYLASSPSERARAARCAFWLGLLLMFRSESGHATGWLGRAQRLVDVLVLEDANDCVESGYLLIPTAEQQLAAGESDAAYDTASKAVEIGERCGDSDLTACARHLQGRALLLGGRIETGLALLDEAMLAATGGELSAVLTGLIYCSVIDACLQVYAFSRAREWTTALGRWCAEQPQLVAFTGTCIVHRAQILQLNGRWQNAVAEVRGICERFSRGIGRRPPGAALYEQGEVHRLRGELEAAEDAYRNASEMGCEPQPGLALLRLSQGRTDAAVSAIRRVVVTTAAGRLERSKLLPAYIEISIAVGDKAAAREACNELESLAKSFPSDALSAITSQARAVVELSEGNAATAEGCARTAWQLWERIEAPYHAARARELLGLASERLGDDEGKKLQLEAARAAFVKLGAAPDVARIDASAEEPRAEGSTADARSASPLTARELQVLRQIAAGKTNKAIARELFVSEKTVERHVSNIFVKLDVPSRSAATAFAYEHKLV